MAEKKKKKSSRKLTAFGKTVKKKLIDMDMTLIELEKAVGASKNYLDLIMHGLRPKSKYIFKIGEILNIDVSKYVA